ncbi:hypothetical protein EVAR_79353_1 [Eumeta japonica]|uniref:Uncharacterized protein n=1 Tax=Eumeta variegata TaxID=151549 RepID=A0A4C1TI93_EUMVA|nr:hypothetical protein EVAR_79353_1 [Eumeta japonica]
MDYTHSCKGYLGLPKKRDRVRHPVSRGPRPNYRIGPSNGARRRAARQRKPIHRGPTERVSCERALKYLGARSFYYDPLVLPVRLCFIHQQNCIHNQTGRMLLPELSQQRWHY